CAANEFESVPPGPDRDRVCQPLTECSSDQYSVPGAAGQDRTCVPLSVCGAGTYVSGAATATTNRMCAPCAAGTFSSQPNVSMCKAWKTCATDETESVAPDLTSDRVCSACGAGKYSLNGKCMALTECAATEYESKPATATSDRTCKAISDCSPGNRQTAAPTKTTDRQCAACGANSFSTIKNADACTTWTVCTAAQYESMAPSVSANRVCTGLTSCAAGQRIKTAATATSNRVCEACPSGSFSTAANSTTCSAWTTCTAAQYESMAPSAIANRVCAGLTSCTAGQQIKTAATATSNRVCEACPSGSFSTTTNAATCSTWSQCAAGTYMSGSATATMDQPCAACAGGTFSATKNAASCQAWKTCANGQGETMAGTPSSDRTCAACATGTYGTGGTCQACAAGTFSSSTGATSCTACTTCGWFPASACTAKVNTVCTKQDTARMEGTVSNDSSGGMAVDSAGNVWLAGTTNQSGLSDVALFKYDSSGNKVKTIALATAGTDRAYTLTLDTAGNVWVAGTTDRALKSGANPSSVLMAFAARFAPDGTAKGVVQFALANGSMVQIAAGNAADVWVTGGSMLTHVTDSGGALVNSAPGDYTQMSTPVTGISEAYGLTVDSNGNPWATGFTDAGIYVYKGTPGGDVFSTGARLTQFGPAPFAQPTALRAKGNNIWVLGHIRNGRFDDNDSTVPATGFGGRDGFIVRVSASDAQPHEVTQFGELGDEYITATEIDSAGNLWVSGQCNHTFAGKTSKGNFDIFAARFTTPASGKAALTTESYLVGTDQPEYQGWIDLDASGRMWLAGSTSGQFPGTANAGAIDMFVMQVAK
ncbi:MAG TPA: hypothetical protein VJV79_01105, partial [Polyangiaceae bacterium]|nr:hypothetical protein [Polyangiaceae bacterium]